MLEEQASERDFMLMDEVLREARADLAVGGAGVAALLASPDQIIAVAHNTIQETGEQARRSLTLYVTLEPCLMCSAALSFVGIKRIVYAALAEDANIEEMIVRNLTLPK